MTGREERDFNKRSKNIKKIEKQPNFVKDWYDYLSACEKSETTCEDYLNKILLFLNTTGIHTNDDLRNITQKDIARYFTGKRIIDQNRSSSDSYKQCIWSALNNFFEFCVDNGYVDTNYITNIKRSRNNDLEKIKKRRIVITEDNYKQIINNVKNGIGSPKAKKAQREMINRNVVILYLLITTGMRKSALCQINCSDISIEDETVFITDKNNHSFQYSLTKEVVKYLNFWLVEREKYVKDTDALFVTNKGNRLSGSALDKLVDKYCSPAVGKHISPHKLRGGFGSLVYEKTGDIEFTRRAMGHSQVTTTQRYITTDNTEMKKATKIMDSMFA